jgi:hypothetical protein
MAGSMRTTHCAVWQAQQMSILDAAACHPRGRAFTLLYSVRKLVGGGYCRGKVLSARAGSPILGLRLGE